MSEMCKDTKTKPKLTPLSGAGLHCSRTSSTSYEARVDIKTHRFLEREQLAFFDLGTFDPNNCRYYKKYLQQLHVINKQEKKRGYIKVSHKCYIYSSGVFNQWQYGKRLPKILFAFATTYWKRDLQQSISSCWNQVCFVSRARE